MYQLVYFYKYTVDNRTNVDTDYNDGYRSAKFRLKRNALHFLREIIQNEYRENGFATEETKSGINCYKSEKIENDGIKIVEITIKVEKA